MLTEDHDQIFESWKKWFSGVNPEKLKKHFATWEKLQQRSDTIGGILAQTRLLPKTTHMHENIADKLNYEIPYRIVVIGESGAGKSSIINAILGQDRLVTGAGGAITGVPVYVYPISSGSKERVVVIFRKEEEFLNLVKKIAKRYKIALPDKLSEIEQALDKKLVALNEIPEDRRQQFLDDLKDILMSWRRLESTQYLGTAQEYDPKTDHRNIQALMEEKSQLNTPGSATRIIAGIAKIEYFLQTQTSNDNKVALQSNIVFIDTPGIGARTIRHEEILNEEIKHADAVMLVVNARRPEDKTASMAHLLNQALLSNFSPAQKDYFAQKVFLIVNQIDAIRDTHDRRRLDDSIRELCSIISPNFWVTHVNQQSDLRYFETIAELAIYAQTINSGGSLPSQAESRYRGYLESQLTDYERHNGNVNLNALEKSEIAALRNKLSEFLGERRLALMLEESGIMLNKIVEITVEECRAFFGDHNLIYDERLLLENTINRNIRHICKQHILKDRAFLNKKYTDMWDAMQKWRRSDPYRNSLKHNWKKLVLFLNLKYKPGWNNIYRILIA